MDEQTQTEQTQTEQPQLQQVASTPAPELANEAAEAVVQQAYADAPAADAPAAAPYLEPSLLQQTEAAIESAVQKLESEVESAVDKVKDFLHLGQHGHAAAQAEDPTHVNPFLEPVQKDQV